MSQHFPIIRNSKVIPQPHVCFLYSKEKNVFDVFNRGALSYLWRIDGSRTDEQIIEEIHSVYPHIDKKTIENDYAKLSCYLSNRGYLIFDDRETDLPVSCIEFGDRALETKLVHADIELTRNCNLSCAYCYANVAKGRDEEELPISKWKAVLDKLRDQGLRVVKVSGGEPFLYHDFVAFMEYCAKYFIVSINTNGWYIDQDKAKWLSSLDLQCVQISLDSTTSEWHDKVRGKGSWERAISAINNLHKYGVHIRLSSTIGSNNCNETIELREIAKTYDAEITFEVMKPMGRGAMLQNSWFVHDACEITQQNTSSPIQEIYKSLRFLEIKCQAQIGFIGISSKGNIKPCNLPEEFFNNIHVSTISPVLSGNFNYSTSDTYLSTESYCSNHISKELKQKQGGHPFDRCIFYCDCDKKLQ